VEEGSARPLEGTTAAAESAPTSDEGPDGSDRSNGHASSDTTSSQSTSGSSSPPSDGRFADLNSYQLKRKLEETEEKIMEIEERQEELEAAMADPEAYAGEGARARELSDEYNALKKELSSLYDTWEALTDHVMALEEG
jgi:ATP-binding cassette subfamily F protein 3